ncbi:M48 family metalloprotease [Embleya sp. NPDC056575]|uniref:M48 family metalloprotease n=1 Tax=unclassified Embleya TaxID=2699296 RepID=UPI0036C2E302
MSLPTAIRDRSGTTARFALLLVLLAVSSVFTLEILVSAVWEWIDPTASGKGARPCLLAAGIDPTAGDRANTLHLGGVRDAFRKCVADRSSRPYRGMIATGVVLVVAGLVYWLQPKVRDRWRGTVPVDAVDPDRALRAELDALRERTGIRANLDFRVDPARMTSGAAVYGRTGRYTVCLHAGLLARRATDVDGFRAVVLHELAHVHHRDVDYAYASTALWRVYVTLVLIPEFAYFGWEFVRTERAAAESPWWPAAGPIFVGFVTTGALLAGLVHLARADLLRHRELHADVRAVAWGASAAGWDRADSGEPRAHPVRRLLAPLRTHPGWAERRRVLADPALLFRAGGLEMFLAGVAAMLLSGSLVMVDRSQARWVTIALITPVVCLAVGLSIVRSPRTDGGTGSGTIAGLWLGCGLFVGEWVTDMRARFDWTLSQPQYLLTFPIIAAVAVAWWSQTLRLALGLSTRTRRRSAATLCAMVTAAVLWGGLTWWENGGRALAVGVDLDRDVPTVYAASFPGTWQDYSADMTVFMRLTSMFEPIFEQEVLAAATLLMWLVPMILMSVQGTETRSRLRPTLVAGLAGALAAWAGLAVMAILLNTRRPATLEERGGAFTFAHVGWMITTVSAACLLTAMLVAATAREHRLPRALIAAQMVQLLTYAAVFLLSSTDGCVGPLNMTFDTCGWRPEWGEVVGRSVVRITLVTAVLGAGFGALMGAGIARTIRRTRGVPTPNVPVTPRRVASRARWLRIVLVPTVPAVLLIADLHTATLPPEAARLAKDVVESVTSGPRPTGLDGNPPTTKDLRLRTMQIRSWWDAGGLRHGQEITAATKALTDALIETDARLQHPGRAPAFDPIAFARACGVLGTRVEEARAYLPVPHPDLQVSWANALADLHKGALDCQTALAGKRWLPNPDEALWDPDFSDSLQEIGTGFEGYVVCTLDLRNAMNHTPE